MLASDDEFTDLLDTPEAPRASAAVQHQAVADALFEAAAAESAMGDGEAMREDPAWLDDPAAYDAAAAEVDGDMGSLEVIAYEDDTATNAARSPAGFNLSSLEHLVLSYDDADNSSTAADFTVASNRQHTVRHASVPDRFVICDSEPEEEVFQDLVTEPLLRSQHAFQDGSEVAQSQDPGSPPEMAVGHNGQLRPVLSAIFPSRQQEPQLVTEEARARPEHGPARPQSRPRQLRVCRTLLPNGPDSAADSCDNANSSSQSMSASIHAHAAVMPRPVLRSSARSQAKHPLGHTGTESSTAEPQSTRCTCRQAKLNKQSSQQSAQHALPLGQVTQAEMLHEDFAVISRLQPHGRNTTSNSSQGSIPGQNSTWSTRGSQHSGQA